MSNKGDGTHLRGVYSISLLLKNIPVYARHRYFERQSAQSRNFPPSRRCVALQMNDFGVFWNWQGKSPNARKSRAETRFFQKNLVSYCHILRNPKEPDFVVANYGAAPMKEQSWSQSASFATERNYSLSNQGRMH